MVYSHLTTTTTAIGAVKEAKAKAAKVGEAVAVAMETTTLSRPSLKRTPMVCLRPNGSVAALQEVLPELLNPVLSRRLLVTKAIRGSDSTANGRRVKAQTTGVLLWWTSES